MDYHQFLAPDSIEVRLPYFRGRKVRDESRGWRLREEISPGWYRFRVRGRFADPVEAIEPELDAWDARKLPRREGYLAAGRFIGDDRQVPLFGLCPDEALPRFSPIEAAEWFSGHLWFAGPLFESETEDAVREAFEEERGIDGIKAVTPPLAGAFLLECTQRELAREALRRKEAEAERRAAEREAVRQRRRTAELESTLEGRIALALSHTGATLLDWRRSGGGRITVRYRLGRRRFECVIDSDSLRIVDAGICLDGADRELSLASLPSAVQEAIETGQLHVMR